MRLRRASADSFAGGSLGLLEEPTSTQPGRLLAANRTDRYEKLLVCSNLDGRILGYIAANEIVRGASQCGFLGYWIGAAYARQGYMTEALELMLRHAFGALGLHRVEANIIPHNRPSIRLVARAGFRKEGLSTRYLEIAGRWQDHERWALLREEWYAKRRGLHGHGLSDPARRAGRSGGISSDCVAHGPASGKARIPGGPATKARRRGRRPG